MEKRERFIKLSDAEQQAARLAARIPLEDVGEAFQGICRTKSACDKKFEDMKDTEASDHQTALYLINARAHLTARGDYLEAMGNQLMDIAGDEILASYFKDLEVSI